MDTPDTNKIEDPEGLLRLLVDSNPEAMVRVLWTELQAERESSKYWEGRTDASRKIRNEMNDKHDAEIARLKEEIAAAKTNGTRGISLSALEKAARADRSFKINAIKALRDETGLGLSESKQAVEWVWSRVGACHLTPLVIEHIVRYSDSSDPTRSALYTALVTDRYFPSVVEAEQFCLAIWKLG